MLKRRVMAVEKRLAGLGITPEKKLREVVVFDDDPEPKAGPDEQLLIIRVIHTSNEERASPNVKATVPIKEAQ
jgi:hypothetical protein